MNGAKGILDFAEISKDDINSVGGKGANLGEMASAGFPIPPGFCVSTAVFDDHMEQFKGNKLFDELEQMDLYAIDQVDGKAEKIRALIENGAIVKNVSEKIIKAINKIGIEHAYAVRSSATAEDLPNASFAGQQDTYLNIIGEEQILKHIKDCWASLYTERAIIYRIQNNISHKEVSMSVVVQRMINSEKSGIMFTADPISNKRSVTVIDAGFGLGEGLVSGIVSADLYRVDKVNNKILEKTIAVKKVAVRSNRSGGTFIEDLSFEQQRQEVLDDEQIVELSIIAKQIEDHYGSPQDIEWCFDKYGDIFITQARTITSLFPVPKPEIEDGRNHVFVSFNHVQVMTETMTPLGQSIFKLIFPFGKDMKNLAVENPIMLSAGGRMYIDITSLLGTWPFSKKTPKILEAIDILIGKAVSEIIESGAIANNKKAKGVKRSAVKIMFPIARKAVKGAIKGDPQKAFEASELYLNNYVEEFEESMENAIGRVEKLELIKVLTSRFLLDMMENIVHNLTIAIGSYQMLKRLLPKDYEDYSNLNKLFSGLEGNVTTEMGLVIGDLAELLRDEPLLIDILKTKSPNQAIAALLNAENGEISQEFAEFFEKYGIRAVGEIDIANKRYYEDTTPIVQSVINHLQTNVEHGHRAKYHKLIQEADEASEAIVRDIRAGKRGGFKAKLAKNLIKNARTLMALREHPKYTIIRMLGIEKKILIEEAECLVKEGLLIDPEDIFYLYIDELIECTKNKTDYRDIITKRKLDYEVYDRLTPPRVMLSDGEIIKGQYDKTGYPEGSIIGSPVSAGVIEGRAKVVKNPKNANLEKGEILVAPFTDPGWTPLFVNAVGLIIEVGGLMTHGAVVAREYGIPAVVGVENATEIIKTGDLIRVHGDKGYIEILESIS